MRDGRRLFRLAVGLAGALGVVLSFLHGPMSQHPVLGERLVRFFSFFTILTNLLAATAMLAPALAPGSRLGRRLAQPPARAAITGFILCVGILYHLLLADDLRARRGLGLAASLLCHYVVPALWLLDWTVLVPRGGLGWATSVRSLAYPLGYLAWILAYGGGSGWYPYGFLDAGRLGYARTARTAAVLAATFLAVGLLLALADRLFDRLRARIRPPGADRGSPGPPAPVTPPPGGPARRNDTGR